MAEEYAFVLSPSCRRAVAAILAECPVPATVVLSAVPMPLGIAPVYRGIVTVIATGRRLVGPPASAPDQALEDILATTDLAAWAQGHTGEYDHAHH